MLSISLAPCLGQTRTSRATWPTGWRLKRCPRALGMCGLLLPRPWSLQLRTILPTDGLNSGMTMLARGIVNHKTSLDARGDIVSDTRLLVANNLRRQGFFDQPIGLNPTSSNEQSENVKFISRAITCLDSILQDVCVQFDQASDDPDATRAAAEIEYVLGLVYRQLEAAITQQLLTSEQPLDASSQYQDQPAKTAQHKSTTPGTR